MTVQCQNCHNLFSIKVHQNRNLPYVPKVCGGICLAQLLIKLKREEYEYDLDKPSAFRSKYEEAFAKWMDQHNIPWMYEEVSFLVKPHTLYIPDFWLPEQNIIVEVKGLWEHSNGKGSYSKFKAFVEKFNIQTWLVDKPLLRRLGCQIK